MVAEHPLGEARGILEPDTAMAEVATRTREQLRGGRAVHVDVFASSGR